MENIKSSLAAIDAATSTIVALYAQKTALERDFHAASENMADNADDLAKAIKRLNFQITKAENERGQLEYRHQWLISEQQRLQNAINANNNQKLILQKRLEQLKFDVARCNEDIERADDSAKYLVKQLATLTGD